MALRLLSAVVGVPIVFACIYFGGIGWWLLLFAATAATSWEIIRILLPGDDLKRIRILLNGYAAVVTVLYISVPRQSIVLTIVTPLILLTVGLTVLAYRFGLEGSINRLGRAFIGVLYAPMTLSCLYELRRLGDDRQGYNWVLLVMGMTWLADTGAYFLGRAIGRTPFAPMVSPKKTWEGFFGAVVAAGVWALIMQVFFMPQLTWYEPWILAAPIAAFGAMGDLTESLIKRDAGIKDSSNLIPGHGGMFDRLDALMFTAPVMYLYAALVHPLLH